MLASISRASYCATFCSSSVTYAERRSRKARCEARFCALRFVKGTDAEGFRPGLPRAGSTHSLLGLITSGMSVEDGRDIGEGGPSRTACEGSMAVALMQRSGMCPFLGCRTRTERCGESFCGRLCDTMSSAETVNPGSNQIMHVFYTWSHVTQSLRRAAYLPMLRGLHASDTPPTDERRGRIMGPV